MITHYCFRVDTAELLWEIYFPMPGVRTCMTWRKCPFGEETVEITVKEGIDAEREMIDWRQSLKPYLRVLGTGMPSWLFWAR